MATKQPISTSIIDRVVQGVKFIATGRNDWFGPGEPVAPQAQAPAEEGGAKGRQFDFPTMFNTQRTPGSEFQSGQSGISFQHMRNLADSYDLLRLVIETRKDQMSKMEWSFGPRDPKGQIDARCDELNNFFQFPDQEHDWETWLRALLEDVLVVDAATVYPRMTLGGDVYTLELVDGTTIKRVIDATGRTPEPPNVAYQQILKGMPAVDYNRDELIYKPRNVRTHRVYGYSPVEQVIMTVNIALRRQVHQLQYYTDGNIPDAFIGVPIEWNVEQVKQFQLYWDSIIEGDTAERRKAKFVPGGMTPNFTKDPKLKDEMDDWLARVICYAFSVSSQPLVKEMNRATAESAMKQATQEGLQPVMNWVKNLMNFIVWKYFGYQDLEFKWKEEDELGPKDQAEMLGVLVDKKIITKDEARADLGRDAMTPEQKHELSPPPPPQLAGSTGGPPGSPPRLPAPDDEPPAPGVADKLGKAEAVSLRKASASPISRKRPATVLASTALAEVMKDALSSLQQSVIVALEKTAKGAHRDAKRIIDGLDLDALEETEPEIAKVLKALLVESGGKGLDQVLNTATDEMLEQVNEFAVDYAGARAAELVKGLEDSTRDMLQSSVVTALEEGWSNDRLASELMSAYAFSAERAMLIARTETAYADVAGNLEGWRASGAVAGKRWIVDPNNPCDLCDKLAGVEVDLDESFPGDGGDGPPLHPNCECDVVPILKEE